MVEKVIIISYGEIALKGQNKRFFENKLVNNIRHAVTDLGKLKIYKEHSRIYIDVEDYNEEEIINRVKKVFGVVSISPAKRFSVDMDLIKDMVLDEIKSRKTEEEIKTFKIQSKRVDKKFPTSSMEISREIGAFVLNSDNGLSVDVHNPDLLVNVEIRNMAFVHSKKIAGFGGLPLGTNGKALLLLSGGIDSPVAGWLVGKRGVEIEAIHFHSHPFTSQRAKEKVIDLAKTLSIYCGKFRLYSINLLSIQKAINENCPEGEMTILSRRFMMKIAEKIALKSNCDALITGESIGQVASQTTKSLHVTNAAVNLPVFRPLIAMDKVDIIDLSKKIDTYETSILPFEDCCTVFLPKHPVTQPKLENILKSEALLDVDGLIQEVIDDMEEIIITLEEY